MRDPITAAEVSALFGVRTPVHSYDLGKRAFDRLRAKYPKEFAEAVAAARARGWKPTESYEGSLVPFNEAMKRHPKRGPIRQDEWGSTWAGEAGVWYWDDGNPNNIEFQIYILGYNTNEDIWVEGSFEPWSDTDGDLPWFEYLGGTRYRERRTREGAPMLVGLVTPVGAPGQITPTQRQCVRNCLKGKLRNSVRDAAIGAGASLFGCLPFSKLYFGCLGLWTGGAFLAGLIYEFAWTEDCDVQCGLTGGGDDNLVEKGGR